MLSVIRKNQHFLTFFIVLLTIISFIWLYNRTNLSQIGVNDVASLYGNVVVRSTVESEIRNYRLAIALGLTDFINDLEGFAEKEDVALTSFIFNILVIQHEAPRLSIVPTDASIAKVIEQLPIFQTEGAFDSNKYALFMKEQLAPRGITERNLEEVARDSLCCKKIYQLITAPAVVSEAQVHEAARFLQPVVARVLRFDRNQYLSNIQKEVVTPQEKKEFYEKNKGLYMSQEERSIEYLCFALAANQQKLQGKERIKAMQQISENAASFKQEASDAKQQGKDFGKSATEHSLNLVKTGFFKKQELEASRPSVIQPLPPEVIAASFKLSSLGDISEVIQSGDRFYLISLARMKPSRQLALSEVDFQIEKILKEQKASQALEQQANQALKSIREAMASGQNFSQAIASLHQKWVTISGSLSPSSSKISSLDQEYLAATLPLKEGEISAVHHSAWGDFIVFLQQRMPLSDVDWNAHHLHIEQELLEQTRRLLFFEWLRQARTDAKINVLDGHHHRSLLSSLFGK